MARLPFNWLWASNPAPDQFEEPPQSTQQSGWVGGAQGQLPEAKWENYWHHRVDAALQQIERDGAMEWLPDVPYAIGAEARHNGINWVAAIASEGIEPGSAQDEGHWKAPGVASSVRIEPIDQVPSANNVQEALAALGALGTNFATEAEAQAIESLTKLISPGRLGDAMNAHVLGMGQSWQDMRSSRQRNTTYTNTTGRAIAISVSISDPGASGYRSGLTIIIDGVEVAKARGIGTSSFINISTACANIPTGSTYRVDSDTGTGTAIETWAELR